MRGLRRVGLAALLALIFAESDSNSDSGDSDSGGSDGSDADSSGSMADSAFIASSGPTNPVGTTTGGSSDDSSSSSAGDDTHHPDQKRKPGVPGITETLEERDLTDIPYKSGDSPIKK